MIFQIFSAFERSLNIILAVIGLASMYPNVTVKNIDIVYDKTSVYVEFDTSSMLNEAIFELLESGIVIDFNYFVSTKKNGKLIFAKNYLERVSYRKNSYTINNFSTSDMEEFINMVNHHRMMILDTYSKSSKMEKGKYLTRIEIGLSSKETPEIIKLWGNKPAIEIEFR